MEKYLFYIKIPIAKGDYYERNQKRALRRTTC